jgi:hypothetical protein
MQLIAAMDPTNPRWETSEARTKRSATMWKIIVAAAGTSALTAMVVASCLDRDVARRDAREPAFVETTSVTTTTKMGIAATPPQAAPAAAAPAAATRDATGGVAGGGGAEDIARATSTSSATTGTTSITSAPAGTQLPARQLTYTPVPVPLESVKGDTSTSGTNGTNGTADAAPRGADAGSSRNNSSRRAEDPNRGSNPQAPSYSAGAGGFVTEAPYWGASAWTSDPNAGAGPFTTERNTPAYGSYGVVGAPGPAR